MNKLIISPTKISFSVTSAGDPSRLSWSSSNEKVVTVVSHPHSASHGEVTVAGPGNAQLVVSDGDDSAFLDIEVQGKAK